jgi:hypothetical protein
MASLGNKAESSGNHSAHPEPVKLSGAGSCGNPKGLFRSCRHYASHQPDRIIERCRAGTRAAAHNGWLPGPGEVPSEIGFRFEFDYEYEYEYEHEYPVNTKTF